MLLDSPMGRGIFTALILFAASALFAAPARAVERPPQFVEIAFDNCTELERWKELTAFAAEMNKDGDRLHFTFFVSGVNFIADGNRNLYEAPGQRRGASRIGFGGSADDVRQRVDYINALYRSGHEIGSHAVGHFSGRGWSAGDWARELHSFRDILANVGPNNGLGDDVKFAFPSSEVVGFRAPYLDTARVSTRRSRTTASVTTRRATATRMPGRTRSTACGASTWRISSCTTAAGVCCRWTTISSWRSRTAWSCRAGTNSSKSRCCRPISIISKPITPATARRCISAIISSIIRPAPTARRLRSSRRIVCGLPEVRCATYSALADFLDRQDPATLAAYRNGDFPHAADPLARRRPVDAPRPAGLVIERPRSGSASLTPPLRPAPPPSRAWRACG